MADVQRDLAPLARILDVRPTTEPGLSMVQVECPYQCIHGKHVRPWRLGQENRSWACTGGGVFHGRFRVAAA